MSGKAIGFEGVADGSGGGASAPPPPGYDQVVSSRPPSQPSFRLMYQDIFPECLKTGGLWTPPVYERFDVVMQRANQWLQSNPQIEIKTCESLEKRTYSKYPVNPNESVRSQSGQGYQYMVRGLRLWFGPKSTSSGSPDQLGYLNCVPGCIKSGGFFSGYPQFESLQTSLSSLNTYLQQQPIPGRIVTVETQDMKCTGGWSSAGVDPDQSLWFESGNQEKLYLFIIRVFYIVGPAHYEEIGVADFVPQLQGGSSSMFFTLPGSEAYHSVMSKAHHWVKAQQGIRVTNVKALDIKFHTNGFSSTVSFDTQRTSYVEHGKGTTAFIRTVRIAYVKPRTPLPPTPPLLLTYRTFVPILLRKGGMMSIPHYESQQETLHRAMAWLNATGAAVLGAESVEIKLHNRKYADDENTIYCEYGKELVVYVSALRIYLHGIYQEPPAELLPAVPVMKKHDSDCLIM
ncbi:uncharacterized protein LOC144435756 [Glandiceps talaboti]